MFYFSLPSSHYRLEAYLLYSAADVKAWFLLLIFPYGWNRFLLIINPVYYRIVYYIPGSTPMKLLPKIAISIFIVVSIVQPNVSKAAGCYPHLAADDFRRFINGGASPQRALQLAINDNHNGTEICRLKINSAFKDRGFPMPFQVSQPARIKSNTFASCNDQVDAIFYRRYPSLRGKKLSGMNNALAREWISIQNSVCWYYWG